MPMTLTLYDKNGDTIMCYMPDDLQWCITGFNLMIQNVDLDHLTVIRSIGMNFNPELWKAFKARYKGKADERI